MPQYFQIGKFVASHGLNGELVLEHNLGKATALKGLETLFLEKEKDNFFPYFIKKATKRSAGEVMIQLEDVTTKEAARKLTPRAVWITEEDFQRFAKKTAPISLLGFDLLHQDENLGEIIEVIEQPHQVLCVIHYKGNEAMIPVHEDSLLKLDSKNRKVHVIIPEGLLDIYS
jgi:16S rRNA processing protein RimM